jgi:two-component system sensor histidine kinase UhpB
MLLDEIIEAQEEERKRVARDLHDETCQLLAALGMSIDIAGLAYSENNLTVEGIQELKMKVEHVLDSVNLIIRDLRPPILDDLGLESAIRWLLQRHLLDRGINYYLIVSDAFRELMSRYESVAATERKTELMLFRMVQEAVTNIAKHSSAKNAFVILESRNSAVQIGIEDDGVGFDMRSVYANTNDETEVGFGLLGIRERVSLLGGTLHICSIPECGTFINVVVPWSSLGVTNVR